MTNPRDLVVLVVVTSNAFAISAETGCPGNVASLPFHLVNRYQIVVPISVNGTGPYSFLLDTGAEMTILDSSLANELQLARSDSVRLVGVGVAGAGSFVRLEKLQAGLVTMVDQRVVVSHVDRRSGMRGVLGMDFLMQFDVLLDYAHKLLCLDGNGAMKGAVTGSKIPLLRADQTEVSSGIGPAFIVSARLTGASRPVRLKLDSGAEIACLYNAADYMNMGPIARRPHVSGFTTSGEFRLYSTLPPQSVQVGSVKVEQVPAITVAGASNGRTAEFDGLLPIHLFRWVFVSWRDQIAVFGR